MNPQTVQATFGCLLHDVGKAVYRAGISDGRHGEAGYRFVRDIDGYGQAKAVLDCIRYHHAAQLRQAKDCGPLAAIAYIADNIAAAADRRQTGDETQFDRYLPLSPVFTHLNGEHPGHTLPPHALDGRLRLPLDGSFRLSAGDYEQILLTLRRELSALPPQEEWLNSLLSVWESCMSTVPSSTNTGESPDISLYDHSKVTAAVGACISEYLLDRGETDYFTALVQQEQSFRLQQAFLLYSADFSGIQKFIYSVSTRNALKSLRSRSFFLELCMEHYIDELLQLCGLSRANLLYSGGGHCYVLLPNTEKTVRAIQAWNTRFNDFLIEQFGVRLYLADGYTPCSANDLTNTPAEEAPYQAMFRRVSHQVAKKKLHRYSVQQLRRMNQSHQDPGQRECRICGRTDALRDGEEDTCICLWCALFESLSGKSRDRMCMWSAAMRPVQTSHCPPPRVSCPLSLPMRPGQDSFSQARARRASIRRTASARACAAAPASMWAITPPTTAWRRWPAPRRVCPAWACAAWMWMIWGSPLSPAMNAPRRVIR